VVMKEDLLQYWYYKGFEEEMLDKPLINWFEKAEYKMAYLQGRVDFTESSYSKPWEIVKQELYKKIL
jgi:hypothetical protein